MKIDHIVSTPLECEKLGEEISAILSDNDILLLDGELASGKTTFVKGILKGLNYNKSVTSPTFTLVNEYNADINVIHIDFYREPDIKRWESLGFYEYLSKKNLIIIEWPSLIPNLLLNEKTITLFFEHIENSKRRIYTK